MALQTWISKVEKALAKTNRESSKQTQFALITDDFKQRITNKLKRRVDLPPLIADSLSATLEIVDRKEVSKSHVIITMQIDYQGKGDLSPDDIRDMKAVYVKLRAKYLMRSVYYDKMERFNSAPNEYAVSIC